MEASAKLDLSKYLQSSQQILTKGQKAFRISGPKKHGKTFLAASLSKFWPKTIPAEKPVNLDDLLWIIVDSGGLNGFAQFNINIPHVINLNDLLKDFEPDKIPKIIEKIGIEVAKRGADKIIFDTVSVFDSDIVGHWTKKATRPDGTVDGLTVYRNVLATHRQLETTCRRLPFKYLVWLCHLKFEGDVQSYNPAAKKADEQKKLAVAGPGGGQLVPAVTGQAREVVYGANVDFDAVLLATTAPGGKVTRKLHLAPNPRKGFAAANRYQHILGEIEDPDLGAIIKKIEAINVADEGATK